MTYPLGDFSFVKDLEIRNMYDDAFKAIDVAEAWNFINSDPGDGGFMFSPDSYSLAIQKNIKYTDHTGATYGMTMRVMQRIARVGWERFVTEYKPKV